MQCGAVARRPGTGIAGSQVPGQSATVVPSRQCRRKLSTIRAIKRLAPAIPDQPPMTSPPLRLGVLTLPLPTPALEPLTSAIVAGVPGCSAHFSRYHGDRDRACRSRRWRSSTTARSWRRPSCWPMRGWTPSAGAARPPAGWASSATCSCASASTSAPASWPPRRCCRSMNCCALRGITRLGLVTPYTADVQQRIVDQYQRAGIEVVAERHPGHQRELRLCLRRARSAGCDAARRGAGPPARRWSPTAPTCARPSWPNRSRPRPGWRCWTP